MKKYNVHVILKDKFHSVVIECGGFRLGSGSYIFFRLLPKEQIKGGSMTEEFAWYPIANTIIEEVNNNQNQIPQGSGVNII